MGSPSLSERLVELARVLQDEPHFKPTAERVVAEVVEWTGPDTEAGISLVRRGERVETVAPTSEVVVRGDALQYEMEEGPCLSAIWDEPQVYAGDLAIDQRWPRWAPKVAHELGVRSMLCSRLFTNADTLGALNVYSPHRHAFDEHNRDEILALSAHAAIAVADAQEIENLTIAVDRRTTIGVALGMVMERFGMSQSNAFSLLKRLSSHSNRKLYDVAFEIAATGKVPADQPSSQAGPQPANRPAVRNVGA